MGGGGVSIYIKIVEVVVLDIFLLNRGREEFKYVCCLFVFGIFGVDCCLFF